MLILKYFIYKYFKDVIHLSEGLANTELMCEIIVLLSLLSVNDENAILLLYRLEKS